MAVAITATYNDSYHSPGFNITVTGLTGFDRLTIFRVDSSGEFPDTPVRGADDVTISGTVFAIADYEAPVGKNLTYRVSASSSSATDTFNRTVSGGWGTANTGQVWSNISGPPDSEHSVSASVARHSLTTIDQTRFDALGVSLKDFDIHFAIRPPVVASGASLVGVLQSHRADSNNHYRWDVLFLPGGACNLRLRKYTGGVQSVMATVTGVPSYSAGGWLHVRCVSLDGAMRMRMWSSTEPESWALDVTDSSPRPAGAIALGSALSLGNTNVLPVVVWYDDIQILALNGQSVNSETVDSGSVGVLSGYNPGTVWLKSVGQPALSRRSVLSQWTETSRPGRVLGEFEVLGRRNKVVTTDPLGGREGTIALATFKVGPNWEQDSSYRDITTLLSMGGTLLLQTTGVDDTGESDLYFEIANLKISRVGVVGGDFAHLFEIQFIEVDRPDTSQESLTLRSWQDVLDQNDSWNSVRVNHTSWLDVLQRSL